LPKGFAKKFKVLTCLCTVALITAAALSHSKKMKQLNVTAFEKAILLKRPGAQITNIEKSGKSDNIYIVTIIQNEKEQRLYAAKDGEIISPTPGE